MPDLPDPPATRRLVHALRRWIGVLLAALALLALSQALWWWETWPVRQMLDAHEGGAGGGQ